MPIHEQERRLTMLPLPTLPSPPRPLFSPHVTQYEVSLPVVIADDVGVSLAWKLDSRDAEADTEDLNVPFDVREVIKTAASAIWSTRTYLLSLPDESVGTIRTQFQPKTLSQSRPILPASPSSSASINLSTSTTTAAGNASQESITQIRLAALEALIVLHHLEETHQ